MTLKLLINWNFLHKGRRPILIQRGEKSLSHVTLHNLFFLILFLEKIIFHIIMLLLIVRPRNKIPAFPAIAGEKPIFFQFFKPNSEKDSLSSFSSWSGHPGGVKVSKRPLPRERSASRLVLLVYRIWCPFAPVGPLAPLSFWRPWLNL